MSSVRFELTERKVMKSFDEDGEPVVDSESSFEGEFFTLSELDDHISKMGYRNIENGFVSNNSHDNHNRDYFEKGIETVHELRIEGMTDVHGNDIAGARAMRILEDRVRVVNEHGFRANSLEP